MYNIVFGVHLLVVIMYMLSIQSQSRLVQDSAKGADICYDIGTILGRNYFEMYLPVSSRLLRYFPYVEVFRFEGLNDIYRVDRLGNFHRGLSVARSTLYVSILALRIFHRDVSV